MTRIRISNQQFVCLVTLFNFVAALLILPAPMAKEAGPDAWLTVPVSMCLGALPVTLLLGILARRHPNCSFFEVAELCLGKWGGRVVLVGVGAINLLLTALIIRDIVDFAPVALLPGTPSWVIAALFTATVAYAAYGGSEVICRLAPLVLILAVVAFVTMAAGLLDEVQWTRVQPFLSGGLLPVLKGSWISAGFYAEFVAMAPYVFQVNRPKKVLNSMLFGNALATVFLSYMIVSSVLVFSTTLTTKFAYPTYALAQQVSAGQFLERLEIILITVWLAGMVVKAAAVLWAATACFGWSVGLTAVKWLPAVTATGAALMTSLWPSQLDLTWFSTVIWTPVMLPLELGLPAALLAGSFWAMRRTRKGARA